MFKAKLFGVGILLLVMVGCNQAVNQEESGTVKKSCGVEGDCGGSSTTTNTIRYFSDLGFNSEDILKDSTVILDGTELSEVDLEFQFREVTNGKNTEQLITVDGVIHTRIKGQGQLCLFDISQLKVTDRILNRYEDLYIKHAEQICAMAQYIPSEADYWPLAYTEVTITDENGKSDTGRYGCYNSPRVIDQNGFKVVVDELVADIKAGKYPTVGHDCAVPPAN